MSSSEEEERERIQRLRDEARIERQKQIINHLTPIAERHYKEDVKTLAILLNTNRVEQVIESIAQEYQREYGETVLFSKYAIVDILIKFQKLIKHV